MSSYRGGEVQRGMYLRVAVLMDPRGLAPLTAQCYRLAGAARDAFRRRHGAEMERQIQDGITFLCGKHDAGRANKRAR